MKESISAITTLAKIDFFAEILENNLERLFLTEEPPLHALQYATDTATTFTSTLII